MTHVKDLTLYRPLSWSIALSIALGAIGFTDARSAKASIVIHNNAAATVSGFGQFRAVLSYQAATDGASAALKVTLTNTSDASRGGYLTAFALNNPNNAVSMVATATASLPSNHATSDFSSCLGNQCANNRVDAEPFGDFDFGMSISPSFLGSGAARRGLGIGETGEFTLYFLGNRLNELTEQSFVDSQSHGSAVGFSTQFFVARFRGATAMDGTTDDIVGAELTPTAKPVVAAALPAPAPQYRVLAVPEPSTHFVWSLLAMMGCLGFTGFSCVRGRAR